MAPSIKYTGWIPHMRSSIIRPPNTRQEYQLSAPNSISRLLFLFCQRLDFARLARPLSLYLDSVHYLPQIAFLVPWTQFDSLSEVFGRDVITTLIAIY
jgi:hypothetical protein